MNASLPIPSTESQQGGTETVDRAHTPATSVDLATLRRHIAEIERHPTTLKDTTCGTRTTASWSLGVPALDSALPKTGLATDGLHEASGEQAADSPAAAAFLAALLARLRRTGRSGPVLVCQSLNASDRLGRLHGPGWRDLGLESADLLILRIRHEREVLWAMEEGLRCAALAAVLAEVESLTFTASRRLSLAAREGEVPALLLRHDRLEPASAALSRWRVAALPSGIDPFDTCAPGLSCWRIALVRMRGGRPVNCDVEWKCETGDFLMATSLADRSAASHVGAGGVAVPHRARTQSGG